MGCGALSSASAIHSAAHIDAAPTMADTLLTYEEVAKHCTAGAPGPTSVLNESESLLRVMIDGTVQ